MIQYAIASRVMVLPGGRQLSGPGAVPAELFSAGGPRFDLELDRVKQGCRVQVNVCNLSDQRVDVRVTVLGSYDRRPDHGKVLVGLGSTEVAAEGAVNVGLQMSRSYRPTHLFLPGSAAQDFVVREVYHRTRSVRSSSGLLVVAGPPLNSYGLTGGVLYSVDLRPMQTVPADHFLTVSAVNRTGQARELTGVVVGDLA